MKRLTLILAAAALASPTLARDSLGMYGSWGAFRDAAVPRCYAIAMAEPGRAERQYQPYADVGSWPRQGTRGQVHFRLARALGGNGPRAVLSLGGQRFDLAAGGADAWASDRRGDAAIVAAMRVASEMTVIARDASGRLFSSTYSLSGAASAMDAAAIGCAGAR